MSLTNRGKRIVILIADDDREDREMTKEAFDELRIINDLRFVNDGQDLMDYLTRTGEFADPAKSPTPDLILLDLNMPRKDGREALDEIKSNPNLKTIPVVVLTTSKQEEDIMKSYNSGANSFVTKPVTFEGLLDAVKTFEKYWVEIVCLPTNN